MMYKENDSGEEGGRKGSRDSSLFGEGKREKGMRITRKNTSNGGKNCKLALRGSSERGRRKGVLMINERKEIIVGAN